MNTEEFLKELREAMELARKAAATVSRGNRPYYCEKYAEVVKETIDRVLSTGEVLIFPAVGVSPTTVKLQWYQGKEYLVNVLDESYKEKAEKIMACLDKKRGLIVAVKPKRGLVEPRADKPWRVDLLKFIENSTAGDIRRWQGLALADDDIDFLHEQLNPLKDIFAYDYDIDQGIIRVIRIDYNTDE